MASVDPDHPPASSRTRTITALDPGLRKCGIAQVVMRDVRLPPVPRVAERVGVTRARREFMLALDADWLVSVRGLHVEPLAMFPAGQFIMNGMSDAADVPREVGCPQKTPTDASSAGCQAQSACMIGLYLHLRQSLLPTTDAFIIEQQADIHHYMVRQAQMLYACIATGFVEQSEAAPARTPVLWMSPAQKNKWAECVHTAWPGTLHVKMDKGRITLRVNEQGEWSGMAGREKWTDWPTRAVFVLPGGQRLLGDEDDAWIHEEVEARWTAIQAGDLVPECRASRSKKGHDANKSWVLAAVYKWLAVARRADVLQQIMQLDPEQRHDLTDALAMCIIYAHKRWERYAPEIGAKRARK